MAAVVDAPYAFLSQPPPSKKRAGPAIPLPSLPLGANNENERPPLRRGAPALTGINVWAAQVQPGSPAPRTPGTPYTPTSPGRRSSTSRRSSLSRRRSTSRSITHRAAPAGSFLNLVDTPATGSYKTPEFDLTALGYDTVFVSLPKTPLTPAHLACPTQMPPPPPSPVGKRVRRFPSFGILRRGRGREPKVPASPTVASRSKKSSSASKPRPPPLNNDLLLAQFLDGGRLDQHATRAMNRAAEGGPVGAVHRDAQGVMWVDAAEPLEYAPLLGSPASSEGSWVAFTPYERRESVSSAGSSTADVGAVVRPAELCAVPAMRIVRRAGGEARDRRRRRPAPLMLSSPPGIAAQKVPVQVSPARRTGFSDSFIPEL
ncbi:hypothetical protein GGF50DRAFT_86666 [Schizophyllum commune]